MTGRPEENSSRTVGPLVIAGLAFITALLVYALTTYPTITWWDSGSYSSAAIVLGVAPPPGSLLLVVLGWLVLKVPTGLEPAYVLNLLAGIIGAATVAIMAVLAVRLPVPPRAGTAAPRRAPMGLALGAIVGVLSYALAVSVWRHAIKFNPYILTTLFTVVILWTLTKWWDHAPRADSWRWIVLLGLLLGLDFSVHRTNLLLVPGIAVWVALRRPAAYVSPKVWFGGLAGALVGLSFHLLTIPIAANQPFLNVGDPSNWSRFYDYISLKQYGGSWLLRIWDRNSSLLSNQTLDVFRTIGDNAFWTAGTLRILGLFSGALAVIGWIVLLWRRTRFALGYLSLWLITAVATIAYFNIPEGFFRPFDRHYLPLMVMLGVLMGVGAGVTLDSVWRLRRAFSRHLTALILLLLLLAPAGQLLRNWSDVDGSRQYFACDFGRNVLTQLPENAILFSNGDNDTWPTMYLQLAEGLRRDVHLINLPLSNTPWYLRQRSQLDPHYPVEYTDSLIAALATQPWNDTTISIPAPPWYHPVVPDSADSTMPGIRFTLPPTIADAYARPQDLALLNLLQENQWTRPICFQSTTYSLNLSWVNNHVRQDGLHYTVVPEYDPEPVDSILSHNLMDMYEYRGYADHSVPLDDVTRQIGSNYYSLFLTLCMERQNHDDSVGCRNAKEFMIEMLPFERLRPPDQLRDAALRMCVLPVESAADSVSQEP